MSRHTRFRGFNTCINRSPGRSHRKQNLKQGSGKRKEHTQKTKTKTNKQKPAGEDNRTGTPTVTIDFVIKLTTRAFLSKNAIKASHAQVSKRLESFAN